MTTRGNAIPEGQSGDDGKLKPDPNFAADIPPEIPFESQGDPEPGAMEEDPRLSGMREFRARDERRRQRRRRLIGICTGVAGTGLLVAAMTTVGHRTEHRSPTTSGVSAHVVREGREALSQSTESLRTPEDRTSVAKGPITVTEQRRLAQTRSAPPSSTGWASRASVQQKVPNQDAVYHEPLARLRALRPGDTKEKVFETFATVFESRNGALVRIEGIRLRARGRSPHHELIEVADVRVADTTAGSLRWFLFGDGRLLAWGRAEEWARAAERYKVETEYKPAASPDRRRLPS
jgi:hypothetical protein